MLIKIQFSYLCLLRTAQVCVHSLRQNIHIISDLHLRTKCTNTAIALTALRERIADNLPHFRFGCRRLFISGNIVNSGLRLCAPNAVFIAHDLICVVRPSQCFQQVKGFYRVYLHRCSCGQQHTVRLKSNLINECQQVIWLRFVLIGVFAKIFASCSVCLIKDDTLVFDLLQQFGCFRFACNKSLRNNADFTRTL